MKIPVLIAVAICVSGYVTYDLYVALASRTVTGFLLGPGGVFVALRCLVIGLVVWWALYLRRFPPTRTRHRSDFPRDQSR